MIQSILVYGLLAALLSALGYVAYVRGLAAQAKGKAPSFFEWQMLLILLAFALVAGLRWQVGVDHLNYLTAYQSLVSDIDYGVPSTEVGFLYLSKLFASLGVHFAFYFGFIAFLQIYFFYRTFNLERHILPFLGAVLVLGSQYLDWMNGMRQALAAAIFVYSTRYILERKMGWYVGAVLLASTFHKSALVLLPFYFIGRVDIFKSQAVTLIMLAACIYVGGTAAWLSSIDVFVRPLAALGYDGYANNLEYILSESQQQTAFGPRRVSVLLLWVILICYSRRLKESYPGGRIVIFYNLGIIGALYFNLFASTGHVFLRPMYYFAIFLPILIAFLLSFFKVTRSSGYFDFRAASVLLLACSFTLIAVAADLSGEGTDYSAYKFFWEYWFPEM